MIPSGVPDERGVWLDGVAAWEFFGTFTLKEDLAEIVVLRQFEAACKRLAVTTKKHVRVAFAWGPQLRSVIHLHALFATIDGRGSPIQTTTIRGLWTLGNVDVQRYRVGGGAAPYLLRHPRFEVAIACPRLRRCTRHGTCRVARNRWPSPEELTVR